MLRELLLPEPLQAKFNMYRFWKLDWPWYVWAICVLVAGIAILFEGAYAAVREREVSLPARVDRIAPSDRPRVAITGDLEFTADNVGEEAAYHIRARITVPGTEMCLELEPVPQLRPGSGAEVRFTGYGWRAPMPLDSTTIRFFLCHAVLGEISEWTVGKFRDATIPFDVTYSDFDNRYRYVTPHVLLFQPSRLTSEIHVRIEKAALAEAPAVLLDASAPSA